MKFADIVSAAGLVQGLLLGAIIYLAHRPDRPTRLLGLFVLTLALRVVPFLLMRLPYGEAHPIVYFIPFYFHYLSVPLLYLYTRRLIGRLDWDRDWIHLIPGLLEFVVFSAIFLLELISEGPFFDDETRRGIVGVHSILAIVPLVYYALLTLNLLERHWKKIVTYYSNLSGKQLLWIRNTLFAMVALAATYTLLRYGPLPLPREGRILFGAVANTLLVYYASLNGLRQLRLRHDDDLVEGAVESDRAAPPQTETSERAPMAAATPSRNTSGEGETNYSDALQQIEAYLKESRDYLDPNLTLSDLAERTHFSDRTLSRVINSESGEHFNGYINAFRIEAARRLLRDPAYDHYNMEGIAQEVGFNNKATFYQAFKKSSDVSPAAYRRQRERTDP